MLENPYPSKRLTTHHIPNIWYLLQHIHSAPPQRFHFKFPDHNFVTIIITIAITITRPNINK
jgi:hypothetical protein